MKTFYYDVLNRHRGSASCVVMYLLSADLFVGRLVALCDFLDDLVPAVFKLCDGVLQLCSAAEVLGGDRVFQGLFSLHDTHLHLC